MSSFLVLLPVGGSRVQYVLSCENPKDQWLYLIRWLNEKNISMASQEEYANPDSLRPRQVYCVVKGDDSYTVFQCLTTPDWESETPAPNFVSDVGSLAWVAMWGEVRETELTREKIIPSI